MGAQYDSIPVEVSGADDDSAQPLESFDELAG